MFPEVGGRNGVKERQTVNNRRTTVRRAVWFFHLVNFRPLVSRFFSFSENFTPTLFLLLLFLFFFFPLPLGSLTLVKFLARNPLKRLQKSAFEHVFESSFEVDLQVVFCFGNELLIITINYWIFFDQVS